MIKPEPPELKALAQFVRQYPDVLLWMKAEYQRELENLPYSDVQTAVKQGRCQVWNELVRLLDQAPEIAAKH